MNNQCQKNTANLVISYNVVMGMIIGIVVVLAIYLFDNYAIVAPLQHAPVLSQSEHLTAEQDRFQSLDTHAHVIVYRDDTAFLPSKKILNIFVNNQYKNSFLPLDRALKVVLCPGKKAINVSLSQISQHHFARLSEFAGESPALQAGKRYYFRVALSSKGKIAARWTAEKEAQSALTGFKLQTRTLSQRVLQERDCPGITYFSNSMAIFTTDKNPVSLSTEVKSVMPVLAKISKEMSKKLSELL